MERLSRSVGRWLSTCPHAKEHHFVTLIVTSPEQLFLLISESDHIALDKLLFPFPFPFFTP